MSTNANSGKPAPGTKDIADAESTLGQALAAIHRLLPKLDELERAGDVQAALDRAAGLLGSAREAHSRFVAARKAALPHAGQARMDAEVVAVIAGAVAAVLGQPYRLVSVQPAAAPVPHLNVWAWEGRTQIFQSHRVR